MKVTLTIEVPDGWKKGSKSQCQFIRHLNLWNCNAIYCGLSCERADEATIGYKLCNADNCPLEIQEAKCTSESRCMYCDFKQY